MTAPIRLRLTCPECDWAEDCGLTAMVRWLQSVGKVRRGREPDAEILAEVFRVSAGQFTCPRCGHSGLSIGPADTGDWPEPVVCEGCGKPIPAERLEAIPGTRYCAACQGRQEQGKATGPVDFCPRCGTPMETRLSRAAGLARYTLYCPSCRR